MTMEEIRQLTTEKDWLEVFPLMKQLRPYLEEKEYIEILHEMVTEKFEMYAFYRDNQAVAITGIGWRTNLYYKRHIFVYDLVTDTNERSKGYGEKLLAFVETLAKEGNADCIALESALHRLDAHRFYEEKFHFDKFCYSFKKSMK